MDKKISLLLERLVNVESLLATPATMNDLNEYKKLTKEYAYLSAIKVVWDQIVTFKKVLADDIQAKTLESDSEMIELFLESIHASEHALESLNEKLLNILIPPDPDDDLNVIMEIRAGTGGDEAALFVGDCVRMYQLYSTNKGWKVEVLSCNESEVGGYKEFIMCVSGDKVKRLLQHEGGTHRVQRVPTTETQGRVHTSAITVAIMLEREEEEIKIDDRDLRIETCRASGAGGQHVNVTDSAVRIVHIPTGIVATCQDERSQHKNKEKAMRVLSVKIADAERKKREDADSELRSAQVGSGDRSERIRTYNFPQNRITDHRVNLTMYNLDRVINGELDCFTEALVSFFYNGKLHDL